MRYKRLKLNVLLLLGIGITGLQAQEVILVAGGETMGSGGSASYSIGQIVYTTNNGGANGSVLQGVQQPFEIIAITGIEEAKGINLFVSAYPNPTNDFIMLSVVNFELSSFSYQMYDMQGKLIESKKLDSNKTIIEMSNLEPANYFLKIIQGKKEIKIFKIIKN